MDKEMSERTQRHLLQLDTCHDIINCHLSVNNESEISCLNFGFSYSGKLGHTYADKVWRVGYRYIVSTVHFRPCHC